MKSILRIAIWTVASFLIASFASGQTTYTQVGTAGGRSGELNFFNVPLVDSSGVLVGNYTLECNSNEISNFRCSFTLVLNGVTYYGKITSVITYFPVNDADNDDNGQFAYNWSATGNGVTLTGTHQGHGYWHSERGGYAPFIDASTVTVN